jgi:hypothetical protein
MPHGQAVRVNPVVARNSAISQLACVFVILVFGIGVAVAKGPGAVWVRILLIGGIGLYIRVVSYRVEVDRDEIRVRYMPFYGVERLSARLPDFGTRRVGAFAPSFC